MGYRSICILLWIGIALPSRPAVQTQNPSNAATPPVVPLCEVLQFPAKYDSREIVTSGVTGNSFHQAQFFDPECSLPKHGGWLSPPFDESYKMGQSTDKKYFKMLRKEGAVWVKLRGRFVATGGPFGPEGAPYEFVILEIVDFHKLSKVYREQYSIGTGRVVPD